MKNRRVIVTLLLVSIILSIVVSGCGNGSQDAQTDVGNDTSSESSGNVIVLKLAHNGVANPDHPQNIATSKFKEIVEQESNGQIKVEVYPAAQLGDARTIVEGVQMGTIEMGDVENGPMGRFVSEAMLWDLPYLFRDLDHAHKVLDGPIGDKIRELYLDKGIRVFAYNDGGFRYFTNNKRPITIPEDMKGLKIRVMESEVMINTINAFGATAVPMAFGEVYTGLQQGTVDGQENPLDLIDDSKYYEVQKYLAKSEHFYYPRQYIISEKFYQSLTPELQEIVEEAVAACKVQRESLKEYSSILIDELESKGMEVSEVQKEEFMKLSQEKVYPLFYETVGNGDKEAGKALIEEVLNTK